MIRKEDLFNSIYIVKKEIEEEEVSFENAKKLIEIINKNLIEKKLKNIKIDRDEFTDLVMQKATSLELPYNYCRVAYIYYGKARKKVKV